MDFTFSKLETAEVAPDRRRGSWGEVPRDLGRQGPAAPILCDHCLTGDCDLCTAVGCYRCPGEHRRHGARTVVGEQS